MSHEAFLAYIIEDPDADEPRLVYADYLDEHGDPERAEFIRVQCRLATLPAGDAERGALEARERQLLAAHERAWLAPLRRYLDGMLPRWQFRRGFVEDITAEARGLVPHAEELFRLAPIRGLTPYLFATFLDSLVALPQLRRLLTLDLYGQDVGDAGLRPWLGSPHLCDLRELRLGLTGLTDASARALAAARSLPGLRTLLLGHNDITDEGALAIARSPTLSGLTVLDLGQCKLTEAVRAPLADRFGPGIRLAERLLPAP